MEIHNTRHHQAFITNLNNFAKDNPQIADKPVAEVLGNLNAVPEAIRTGVRNSMGGHANHAMFWEIMGPSGGQPASDVLEAINRDLGGVDKMKSDFNAAGLRVFGSGWVFITVAKDGKLAIEMRPGQDNPMMDGKRALLGNDVWEHAYYLNYQNRRGDYLTAWWNTVNWTRITERYAAAKAGTLRPEAIVACAKGGSPPLSFRIGRSALPGRRIASTFRIEACATDVSVLCRLRKVAADRQTTSERCRSCLASGLVLRQIMPMVLDGCGFLNLTTDTGAERVSTATAISGIKVTPMPAPTI